VERAALALLREVAAGELTPTDTAHESLEALRHVDLRPGIK